MISAKLNPVRRKQARLAWCREREIAQRRRDLAQPNLCRKPPACEFHEQLSLKQGSNPFGKRARAREDHACRIYLGLDAGLALRDLERGVEAAQLVDQADLDGDALGDVCDPDRDGDLGPNQFDAFPDDPSETSDTDSDGIGDNSDNDLDNDGCNNSDEVYCATNPLDG